MHKKNTILLSGYFGFENAGDEAVLSAVVQMLRRRLPDARLVVLSAAPEATASRLAQYGAEAIDRRNMTALKQELKNAALFISGGGSLFQDVTSVRSVLYYASLLNQAQRQGVPTVVLAQGLGPLNTLPGRFMTKRTMAKAEMISWRDQDSYALAAKIGLPKEKMSVICDPVLLWQPFGPGGYSKREKEGKTVGFAIRPWQQMDLGEMAKAIDILQGKGYYVLLLPFHQGVDDKIAEKINHGLRQSAKIQPCAGPEAVYRAIGGLDFLLGMRLHALIMAKAQGVPAGAVSYDPKVDSFAKQAGQPVVCKWDHLSAPSIVEAVEKGIARREVVPAEEWQALWQQPIETIAGIYNRAVK